MSDTTDFSVPRYTSTQARCDYSQRDAERYRRAIREMWSRGIRRPGELAAALNGRDLLAPTGRPWAPRTIANLLKLLRLNRSADTDRDADALEELLAELWGLGYRTRTQLGGVLARLEVSCPWGGPWNASKADRLIRHHAGEWMADSAGVRLRHANDALKLEGYPELPAIGRRRAAPPAMPPELCEPQEAGPRRRSVRI